MVKMRRGSLAVAPCRPPSKWMALDIKRTPRPPSQPAAHLSTREDGLWSKPGSQGELPGQGVRGELWPERKGPFRKRRCGTHKEEDHF